MAITNISYFLGTKKGDSDNSITLIITQGGNSLSVVIPNLKGDQLKKQKYSWQAEAYINQALTGGSLDPTRPFNVYIKSTGTKGVWYPKHFFMHGSRNGAFDIVLVSVRSWPSGVALGKPTTAGVFEYAQVVEDGAPITPRGRNAI